MLASERSVPPTKSSVSRRRPSRRLSSKVGVELRVHLDLLDPAEVQPLRREVADERLGRARIGEHPADLRLEPLVLHEFAPLRRLEERLVRDRAPEEEGEAGCDLEAAQGEALPGDRPFGDVVYAKEERRVAQEELEGELDPRIEASSLPDPPVVEGEERLHLPGRGASAVGAARHPREDLRRTRDRLGPLARVAGEDPLPARGVLRDPGRPVRATDLEGVDLLVPHIDFVIRDEPPPLDGLRNVLRLDMLAHVGDADETRSRLDEGPKLQVLVPRQHVGFPLDAPRLARAGEAHRGGISGRLAPDREALEKPSVEPDVEPLRPPHPHDVVLPVRPEPDAKEVLPAHREVLGDADPPPRPEGEILPLPPLLQHVKRDLVRRHLGIRRREPHGEAGHLPGHREVAFHVGRREGERRRHVVEAPVRRGITRKELRDVHVNPEEVADRIVVLEAVHPVDRRHPPGVRALGPPPVELSCEPHGDGVVDRSRRPRHPGRGHHPGLELPDHALKRLRSDPRVPEVHPVEGESAVSGSIVVAGDAVGVHDLADVRGGEWILDRAGRGGRAVGPRRRRARDRQGSAKEEERDQSMATSPTLTPAPGLGNSHLRLPSSGPPAPRDAWHTREPRVNRLTRQEPRTRRSLARCGRPAANLGARAGRAYCHTHPRDIIGHERLAPPRFASSLPRLHTVSRPYRLSPSRETLLSTTYALSISQFVELFRTMSISVDHPVGWSAADSILPQSSDSGLSSLASTHTCPPALCTWP